MTPHTMPDDTDPRYELWRVHLPFPDEPSLVGTFDSPGAAEDAIERRLEFEALGRENYEIRDSDDEGATCLDSQE